MADPRRGRSTQSKPYPRVARVNESIRHAVATALERIADRDERLPLLTITGVECEPDLRRARVYFASLDEASSEALEEERREIQAAISLRLRTKRIPHLSFKVDPAVLHGEAVEAALRAIRRSAK
jgi:ribosome-binding factor A